MCTSQACCIETAVKTCPREKRMWKVNTLLMLYHIRGYQPGCFVQNVYYLILLQCMYMTLDIRWWGQINQNHRREGHSHHAPWDQNATNFEQLFCIFREAIKTEKTTCSALTHETPSPFSRHLGQKGSCILAMFESFWTTTLLVLLSSTKIWHFISKMHGKLWHNCKHLQLAGAACRR